MRFWWRPPLQTQRSGKASTIWRPGLRPPTRPPMHRALALLWRRVNSCAEGIAAAACADALHLVGTHRDAHAGAAAEDRQRTAAVQHGLAAPWRHSPGSPRWRWSRCQSRCRQRPAHPDGFDSFFQLIAAVVGSQCNRFVKFHWEVSPLFVVFPVPRAHARPDSAGGSPAAGQQAARRPRLPPMALAASATPGAPQNLQGGRTGCDPADLLYNYCNTKLRHRQQKKSGFLQFGQNFSKLATGAAASSVRRVWVGQVKSAPVHLPAAGVLRTDDRPCARQAIGQRGHGGNARAGQLTRQGQPLDHRQARCAAR